MASFSFCKFPKAGRHEGHHEGTTVASIPWIRGVEHPASLPAMAPSLGDAMPRGAGCLSDPSCDAPAI